MGFDEKEDKKSMDDKEYFGKMLGVLYKIRLHDLKLKKEEMDMFDDLIQKHKIALELEVQRGDNNENSDRHKRNQRKN